MLKIPWRLNGHSTLIIPIKPRFCIDITSIPKDAVVAKRTVAFAVTWHDKSQVVNHLTCFTQGSRNLEGTPFEFHKYEFSKSWGPQSYSGRKVEKKEFIPPFEHCFSLPNSLCNLQVMYSKVYLCFSRLCTVAFWATSSSIQVISSPEQYGIKIDWKILLYYRPCRNLPATLFRTFLSQNLRTYRNFLSYSRWKSPGIPSRNPALPLLGPSPETTQKRNHLQPENCPEPPEPSAKETPRGVALLQSFSHSS